MKRQLSLVLALVMILGSFSTVFAAETVEPTVVAEAGAFLKTNKVLEGDDGDLMLSADLKRRDAVVLMSRLYGEEEVAKVFPSDDLTFTDITDDHYNGYIAWSVEKGIIEGHYAHTFGFNEEMTAQQFATVLLRVLGYEVSDPDYPKALATATKLGLLKDIEAENTTVVTRGMMAVMTYNALGIEVKGTGKTLADTLGITMPAPEKIEVESVTALNLREIEVEFNTVKGLNLTELTNASNYRTDAGKVKEVSVHADTVVLLLEDNVVMTQNGKYELTIRDIADLAVTTKAFTAFDNTAPVVEDVVVLGSMGIRVRMSEPVKDAHERDFLLDGKKFVSSVTTNGRDVTIVPYPSFRTFEKMGEQKLTVQAISDFAGYKSAEYAKDIDIKADATKPVVESMTVKNNSVIVTFVDEVYPASVDKSNIKWNQYQNAIKGVANDAKVLSGKRVEYTFAGVNELPKPTVEIELTGVKNYSNVAMDKHTETVLVDLDFARPEIVSWALVDDLDATQGKMRLVFNKDLDQATVEDIRNYTLYKAQDLHAEKRLVAADGKDVVVTNAVEEVMFEQGSKNVVIVRFETSKIVAGQNYILETKNLRDNTTLRNVMIPKDISFTDGLGNALEVISATTDYRNNVLTLVFNKQLNREYAERLENYRLETKTGNKEFTLEELSRNAVIELYNDGRTLDIKLPENQRELTRVRVSSSVRALDGNRYLDNNWININGVLNKLTKVTILEGNNKLELDFNLPVVRLANNAHVGFKVMQGTTEVAKATNVAIVNGKVIVTLNNPLVAGTYTVEFPEGLGFTKYNMAVEATTLHTITAKTVDAPTISNAHMVIDNTTATVVVGFDQLMKMDDTLVDKVNKSSMKNLVLRNKDTNVKYYFTNAALTYAANNELTAVFSGANLLTGGNYEIVVNQGLVEAANGKFVAPSKKDVIVELEVDSISAVNATENIVAGQTKMIDMKATRGSQTNVAGVKYTFTSSIPGFATVDANGKITAVSAGTSTITVTTTNAVGTQKTTTVNVNVTAAPVVGVVSPNPATQTVAYVAGSVVVPAQFTFTPGTITSTDIVKIDTKQYTSATNAATLTPLINGDPTSQYTASDDGTVVTLTQKVASAQVLPVVEIGAAGIVVTETVAFSPVVLATPAQFTFNVTANLVVTDTLNIAGELFTGVTDAASIASKITANSTAYTATSNGITVTLTQRTPSNAAAPTVIVQ